MMPVGNGYDAMARLFSDRVSIFRISAFGLKLNQKLNLEKQLYRSWTSTKAYGSFNNRRFAIVAEPKLPPHSAEKPPPATVNRKVVESTNSMTKPRPCGHSCGHEKRRVFWTRLTC